MANFKQCKLIKLAPPGFPYTTYQTTWIPEQFAKKGKVLDLLDSGWWDNGWEVVEVYNSLPEEYVREHERDYKTQAEASDKFTPNKGLKV